MPFVSDDPTARMNGSTAGAVIEPSWAKPAFPAAATTTIPFRHATSAAKQSGSSAAGCVEFVPYERLMTRMLLPLSLRCWTTQSIPAITCETSVAPCASATLTETILASGAIPRKCDASPAYAPAVAAFARPAMMPARCVP